MSENFQKKETVTLYEEFRLIEKDDSEVSVVWRGVQLLLFFLAFVFGSFCTFCIHMLMYMFDDKCVLFPKLISLKELKKKETSSSENKLLYDYLSNDNDIDALPVDFVSTRWVDKSTCYLPTYVPLWSGICGLIWTTIFLMCSSGSQTLTGLQRPWRILPTVFVFSLAIGILSIYTSVITQTGLNELCTKLGQVAGTNTCTYTINVATLAYERRIRGVYSATRLTILSAWLHTLCWIGSALTVLLRIILVVDFRLVKVRVDLKGDIEKMLERHEKHIRTDEFINKNSLHKTSTTSIKVRFVNKGFGTDETNFSQSSEETIQFVSTFSPYSSENSLVPDEARKLTIISTESKFLKENRFIVEMLHDIVDSIGVDKPTEKVNRIKMPRSETNLLRQHGEQFIRSASRGSIVTLIDREEAQQLAENFRRQLERKKTIHNFEVMASSSITITPSSVTPMKSNLKNKGVQTEESKKDTFRVQISSPPASKTNIQVLKAPESERERSGTDSTTTYVPDTQERDHNSYLRDGGGQTEEGMKATTSHRVQMLPRQTTETDLHTIKAHEERVWDQSEAQSTVTIISETSLLPRSNRNLNDIVQVLDDEDTLAIPLLQDIQQQPKIEETKDVAKKEHGILISDDEKSGPSRTEDRQNDPNDKKEHSEKNKNKEKQD